MRTYSKWRHIYSRKWTRSPWEVWICCIWARSGSQSSPPSPTPCHGSSTLESVAGKMETLPTTPRLGLQFNPGGGGVQIGHPYHSLLPSHASLTCGSSIPSKPGREDWAPFSPHPALIARGAALSQASWVKNTGPQLPHSSLLINWGSVLGEVSQEALRLRQGPLVELERGSVRTCQFPHPAMAQPCGGSVQERGGPGGLRSPWLCLGALTILETGHRGIEKSMTKGTFQKLWGSWWWMKRGGVAPQY